MSSHNLSQLYPGTERAQELFGIFSYKGIDPAGSEPYSMTPFHLHFSLEALYPNTATLGIIASNSECWGTQTFSPYDRKLSFCHMRFADIQNPINIPQDAFSG